MSSTTTSACQAPTKKAVALTVDCQGLHRRLVQQAKTMIMYDRVPSGWLNLRTIAHLKCIYLSRKLSRVFKHGDFPLLDTRWNNWQQTSHWVGTTTIPTIIQNFLCSSPMRLRKATTFVSSEPGSRVIQSYCSGISTISWGDRLEPWQPLRPPLVLTHRGKVAAHPAIQKSACGRQFELERQWKGTACYMKYLSHLQLCREVWSILVWFDFTAPDLT